MRTATALAALVAMCFPTRLGAQVRPAVNNQDMENAAVKYLRADAALRQSYALSPDAAAKLEKALELPLDGEDEKLVAAAEEIGRASCRERVEIWGGEGGVGKKMR